MFFLQENLDQFQMTQCTPIWNVILRVGSFRLNLLIHKTQIIRTILWY